jgi:hypothetical protein
VAKGVENSATGKVAKLALRRQALAWIGPREARVFEGYAGNGAMWRAVWREAAQVTGCDRRVIWDPNRRLYVAPIERVLRAIDLSGFNIFDLDAFGSPWPAAYILSARRKLAAGERCVLITTDGAGIRARFGALEKTFALLAGVSAEQHGAADPAKSDRLARQAAAELARRMGGKLAWANVAAQTGNNNLMTYGDFGMEGAA